MFRSPVIKPVGSELLIAAASVYFSICYNEVFWSALLDGRDWSLAATWRLAGSVFVIITAVHCLILGTVLGLVLGRRSAKPVLILLCLLNAAAAYYMRQYQIHFDPGMLRNVLRTDAAEAQELLSFGMAAQVLLGAALPALLIARVPLLARPWRRALAARLALLAGSAAIAIGCVVLAFQDLSAVMRNQKELRYLVTPGNYLVSSMRVLAADTRQSGAARQPVGADAVQAPSWEARAKPVLLVLVVGETARAANWGLNGYARQTTPRLAQRDSLHRDVLNYPRVRACGTSTEASLPCMFSPFGRKDYDAERIRSHESLLHVLERAGFKTLWRDNQSGCKGVCDGLELQSMSGRRDPALCDGERCLDEILLDQLETEIGRAPRNMVVVLHQIGNHGPAYARRYPPAFRRFAPTCETADLGRCSRQEIVNTYDNALLYTDHVLDQAIQRLQAQRSHDSALIYVSDHGESLGETGIYLHGMPYAIAPKEQLDVPMAIWMSPGFSASLNLDRTCLRARTGEQLSHDHLFHSVLGMLQVSTHAYDRAYDITAGCRA